MSNNNYDYDNKVVQSNDLMRTVWTMDSISLKIFEMAVSCLNTSEKDNIVYLKKRDVFKMFDAIGADKYSRFKEHFKDLQRQLVTVFDKDTGQITQMSAVPTVSWNLNSDEIRLEFNTNLMPYLVQLKGNYTQYEIQNLRFLNSKYAMIIYKLAKMNTWNKNTFSIRLSDLRHLTDTRDKYLRFEAFSRVVLKKALDEINDGHTDIVISYSKIKNGRDIVGIEFTVKPRTL
jgi:plasmid replication initiation protein